LKRILEAVFCSVSSTWVAAPTLMSANAGGRLRQALLELLGVVVGRGLVDLDLDLVAEPPDKKAPAAAPDLSSYSEERKDGSGRALISDGAKRKSIK
jgi:hypothetical protein